MDLSRKSLTNRKYPKGFSPPDFSNCFEGLPGYEEFNTYNSSIFPTRSFIEETITTLTKPMAKRRHALECLLERLSGEDLPSKEHLEQYLRHQHRHNCRPNTLRSSYVSIQFFLTFINNAGKTLIEEITSWDLEAFIEHEQDRGLKLSTVRTRLGILKAFVRFLTEAGTLQSDVFPWKMKIKPPQTLPRAMEPDDVNRLLAVNGATRDRAMVLLLLRSGMRIGELLNTKVGDINLKEQKIMIFESEKSRLGRVVYFTDDAGDALKAWLKERDPKEEFLFYGRGSNPLTYPAARMVFVNYLNKAGLSHRGYTPHCLRHTYATELINAGMPLECLKELMGHTSLEVTRRYARLTDTTREKEYFRAMSKIERGETDGHYGLNCELQEILKEKELLSPHSEELPEQP